MDHRDVAEAGGRVITDQALWGTHHDLTTDTFEEITGRPPRPVAEFLHDHRGEFV